MYTVKAEFDPLAFELKEEMREVNNRIYREQIIGKALPDAKRRGFDPNTDKVTLTNRGRRNLRQLKTLPSTINSDNLGLKWRVEFAGGIDPEAMIQAALFAQGRIKRRAPINTGKYVFSVGIWTDNVTTSRLNPRAIGFDEDTRIRIGPVVAYGAVLEHGFGTNYYETERIAGGIVRPVARLVRRTYGPLGVAARFVYVRGPEGRGTLPVIEIAPSGTIPENDSRIGAGRRRRSRRR